MTLLPTLRSPFPASGGTTADGSATAPYITETAGQAGLDAIAAANTIADGDWCVIDAGGDPVLYRAAVIGSRVFWYTPLLGAASTSAEDGVLEEDPADDRGMVEAPGTGGAIDYDSTVASRIGILSGNTGGQASIIQSKTARAARNLMFLVAEDVKVDAVSGSSSDIIAFLSLTTTGGQIGFVVAGDTDEWQIGGDSNVPLGVTATTESTLELYYDATAGRAFVRVNRGAQLISADVGYASGVVTAFLMAGSQYIDSAARTLSFSSLYGRLEA